MKKIFVLLIIVLSTGCFNNEKIVKCKSFVENKSQNYKSSINYKIYYKNSIVTKTIINETYTSSDSNIISYFSNSLDSTYSNLNKFYGGYNYKSIVDSNKLVFNITIDYSKVNLKKMLKDDKINSDYVRNGKYFRLSGAKDMYESKGAICDI